jgi:hypothetical protein
MTDKTFFNFASRFSVVVGKTEWSDCEMSESSSFQESKKMKRDRKMSAVGSSNNILADKRRYCISTSFHKWANF